MHSQSFKTLIPQGEKGRLYLCTFISIFICNASVFAFVHMCLSFETLILHEEERLAVSFYLWLSDLSDSLVTATDYGFHFEHWMWTLNIEYSYSDWLQLPFSFYSNWWLGLLLANTHIFKNGKWIARTLSHRCSSNIGNFLVHLQAAKPTFECNVERIIVK